MKLPANGIPDKGFREYKDLEVAKYYEERPGRDDLADVEIVIHGEQGTLNIEMSHDEYKLFREHFEERTQ